MAVDPAAQALHEKCVLGGVLTPEEKERLLDWYATLGREEETMLARSIPVHHDLPLLRDQVDAAAAQLVAGARRIQTLVAENEKLRLEIAAIEKQLAGKSRTQPV